MEFNNNIEITSPVGSYETLQAAIQGGADSVYLGIGTLNMRSRSTFNFTISDLPKIIKKCKENNVKLYVTVNTIIYNEELEEVKSLLKELVKFGIDAVVATDMAVILLCHEHSIPVHASTQLNISNIEAVKFFSKYADTMVLARELSLEQVAKIITQINQQKITGPSGKLVKIEIFVHGALCMAISGKCYLSLDNYNYSANRGACFQICRRAYRVFDEEKEVELLIDNKYIMSPKDLCTIEFIDKIIESGVSIFKIEGRARAPEYVKTVTHVYKNAVELYYKGLLTKETIRKLKSKLKDVFNRGFWDGYYLGKKTGEWTDSYGSQSAFIKEYVGKVTNYFSKIGVVEITLESGKISLAQNLLIIGPTTGVEELHVEEIRVNLKNVEEAIKGEMCSIPVKNLVRRNDKVYKLVRRTELLNY